MYKLNIGCNNKIKENYINADIRLLPDIQVLCSYENLPFKDNSIIEILSSHVLEHLVNPVKALKESNRVLIQNGVLNVYVPNYKGYLGLGIGHNSYFSIQYFLDLNGNHDNQNNVGCLFKCEMLRLNVFHHRSKHPENYLLRKILKVWEYFWNSSNKNKLYWEVIGIIVPGEIHFIGLNQK